MYERFYGFTSRPFNMTPDSEFFFASSKHEEALNRLLVAISEKSGFAVITGEIGSGKTTVCRALLNKLDPTTKVCLILNTHLGKKELITTILEDLGIEYRSTSKTHLLAALNKYLIEQASRDNNVVLIIDEAQNLTPSVLEEVRMLSNLETEKEKLIQIILIGQPDLKKKLDLPRLEQFRQRIVLSYHMEGLSQIETENYIKFRLKKAGNEKADIFSENAITEIYKYSKGIPRLINLACHNMLISGLVYETRYINRDIASETIHELTHGEEKMPSLKKTLPPDKESKVKDTDTLTQEVINGIDEYSNNLPSVKNPSLNEIDKNETVTETLTIPQEGKLLETTSDDSENIALSAQEIANETYESPNNVLPEKRRFPLSFLVIPPLLIALATAYFALSRNFLGEKNIETAKSSYTKFLHNGVFDSSLIKNGNIGRTNTTFTFNHYMDFSGIILLMLAKSDHGTKPMIISFIDVAGKT